MAYSKLFSSLVHSSLWGEQDHVRLLFITLLAVADRDGHCWGSRSGFERLAMLDPDAHYERDAWTVLMSPDKDSSDRLRNPDNEGRRIREIPGGFEIINYAYYRSLRNDDDRKEQNREAQRRHRAKNKPKSPAVSPGQPPSAHAEAEAEAKKKKRQNGAASPAPQSVEDWLKQLQADPAYCRLNVKLLYSKMINWCKIRSKEPTKRRFINWLNKEDQPMTLAATARTITKAQPPGWHEWLRKSYPEAKERNFWKVPQSVQDEFRKA